MNLYQYIHKMKLNLNQLILLFLAINGLISSCPAEGCTTAVVSGKYTRDGRPLLLKHRDTDTPDNKLMILAAGKYKALALVDSKDSNLENIWIGFNETGFAIMNSARQIPCHQVIHRKIQSLDV